jgi:thioredoxin 1
MSFQNQIWDIDETNHQDFLKNNFSIMHFFSEWEMDCLMFMPIIESIAEEFTGRVLFGKVNIEEAEAIAKKHKVFKSPSILFFKHGSLIDRIDKFDCEDLLREKINCML